MNEKYRIVGAKRTVQGWEFVADPVGKEIKFVCTNEDTTIFAWRALHEDLECSIRFNEYGQADLIGVPMKEKENEE